MRIVCLSDTHAKHRQVVVPDGDVLVHAGDLTKHGEVETVLDVADWLRGLPHKHKLVVPGNHDFCLDISKDRYSQKARDALDAVAYYCVDRVVAIDGLRFYGAPWVPNLALWAFHDRGRDMFRDAPCDIDVLVTHGPPHGVRDGMWEHNAAITASSLLGDPHTGSRHLRSYIARCPRLRAHIFGHVHEAYGLVMDDPIFVNAAICTREYEPTNAPIVIEV